MRGNLFLEALKGLHSLTTPSSIRPPVLRKCLNDALSCPNSSIPYIPQYAMQYLYTSTYPISTWELQGLQGLYRGHPIVY